MDKHAKIKAFIESHFLSGKTIANFNETLFTSGAIDSLGVLELIAYLETTFNILIDTQQHELIEFDTINSIVQLVDKLSNGSHVTA